MGSPIDVGGQYPFITFFTPPRLSGKFPLKNNRNYIYIYILLCMSAQEHVTSTTRGE